MAFADAFRGREILSCAQGTANVTWRAGSKEDRVIGGRLVPSIETPDVTVFLERSMFLEFPIFPECKVFLEACGFQRHIGFNPRLAPLFES